MDRPTRLAAGLIKRLQEKLAIFVVAKDLAALVASAHDVVDRARILDSQSSRHRPDSTPNAPALKVTIPVFRD